MKQSLLSLQMKIENQFKSMPILIITAWGWVINTNMSLFLKSEIIYFQFHTAQEAKTHTYTYDIMNFISFALYPVYFI
jgi:hypothetical protein